MARLTWARLGLAAVGGVAGFGVYSQTPAPPQLLPPHITGGVPSPPMPPAAQPVRPAGQQTVGTQASPMERFKDLKAFPAETEQALMAARSGAEWLWRMNHAGGRFTPGVNVGWMLPLDGDGDCRQAAAALALCEAARFTGDDKFAARAAGAVLAMRTMTKVDAADPACRVPTVPPERGERVLFAATLALAIHALPGADAAQLTEAEALCAFVRKQCQANGAISGADPEGMAAGAAILALAAGQKSRPEAAKQEVLNRVANHYRGVAKAQPSVTLAANLLPGLCEVAAATRGDATQAAAAFELADQLCAAQQPRSATGNPLAAGGFKMTPNGEPGADSAQCVLALAAVVRLTRQGSDVTKFYKYRGAAVEGLNFLRVLQFTPDNAGHFDKAFRTQYLQGGCRLSLRDANVRADATGQAVRAALAFLQSGGEGKID